MSPKSVIMLVLLVGAFGFFAYNIVLLFRLVTLGKDGSLHARRQALAFVQDKAVVARLFSELGPRFRDRSGGYTRIVKVGRRRGDAAPLSVIELLPAGTETEAAGGDEAESDKAGSGEGARAPTPAGAT